MGFGAETRDLRFAAVPVGIAIGGIAAASLALLGPFETAIVIALLLGLALLFVRPGLFFFLAVALYSSTQATLQTSSEINFADFEINASKIYVTGLTGLLILRWIASAAAGENMPAPQRVHVMHAIFAIYAVTGIATAYSAEGFSIYLRLVVCALIHYLSYWLAQRNAKWIDYAIASAAFAAAISSLFQALTTINPLEVISVGAQRADGSFGGPVSTATIAFATVPTIAKWLILGKSRFEKRLGLLGAAAIAVTLAATLTRTAIVGISLFGLFMTLFGRASTTSTRWRGRVVAILMVVAVFGGLALLPDQYIDARVRDIPGMAGNGGLDPNAGSGRVMIWEASLAQFAASDPASMIFGHGLASSLRDLMQTLRITVGVHNSYLCALYELGLIGLGLMLLELLMTYKSLRSNDRQSAYIKTFLSIYRCYFVAYLLSTILFNDYHFAIGAKWFSYLGFGQALAIAQNAALAPAEGATHDVVTAEPAREPT